MDKAELNKYEKITRERIQYLIRTRCNGSQQIFANKVGINKGSVSQYVSGRNTPSNKTAERIANAFNCDPAWVMGFTDKFNVAASEIIGDIETQEKPTSKKYYYDAETAALAQELFDNKDMRILFDAARDSKPEDLKIAADLLSRLKSTNPDG